MVLVTFAAPKLQFFVPQALYRARGPGPRAGARAAARGPGSARPWPAGSIQRGEAWGSEVGVQWFPGRVDIWPW